MGEMGRKEEISGELHLLFPNCKVKVAHPEVFTEHPNRIAYNHIYGFTGSALMIPNMFKIAGELTSTVFHVSARRSIAAAALSIFGDHSDVMATRSTGWALLPQISVQEVMDFALIAQAATLEARVPFIHFFDGFRTSHEVAKIEQLTPDDMKKMIDQRLVLEHRKRGLNP